MYIIFTYNVLSGSNGYKSGFNGQVKEDEIYGEGNAYSAKFWEYDSRLGRRWNIDPVDQISISNYAVLSNSPLYRADKHGDHDYIVHPNGEIKIKNTKDKDDRIVVVNNYGEPLRIIPVKKGVLGSTVKKGSVDGETYNYFTVTGDEIALKIFLNLAHVHGTAIMPNEWGWLNYDNEKNIIVTTINAPTHDVGGIDIIDNFQEKPLVFTHSHPGTPMSKPSGKNGDMGAVAARRSRQINTNFAIYTPAITTFQYFDDKNENLFRFNWNKSGEKVDEYGDVITKPKPARPKSQERPAHNNNP